MAETRKIAAILVADVVGYSRLAGADEEGTLARLRALRNDLVDPAIAAHHGRVVKRTGDGSLIEFRSVVDAVRCAVEVQNRMVERNAGVAEDRRIQFRVGVHLGDVVEEADGDLMGDGVNIAARLEGIAKPGAICLSEDAYRQVKGRLDLAVIDLGPIELKNIAEPIRVYSLDPGAPAQGRPARTSAPEKSARPRLSMVVLPFANIGGGVEHEPFVDGVTESLTTNLSRIRGAYVIARNTAFAYKAQPLDLKTIGRELNVRYVLEGSVQRGGNRVEALRLSPRDTMAYVWMTNAGNAKNHLGSYEQAVAWCRRAIEANRNHPVPNFVLGAALAQLGRVDEARSAVEAGLALNPTFVLSRARGAWIARSDNPTYLAQLEPILEGLRKAGVPEE
jgi:adenylate cyclase